MERSRSSFGGRPNIGDGPRSSVPQYTGISAAAKEHHHLIGLHHIPGKKEMRDHPIIPICRAERHGFSGPGWREVVGALYAGVEWRRLILMQIGKNPVCLIVDRLLRWCFPDRNLQL